MYDRDVRPDVAPDPVRSCLGYLGPATVTPVARARRIVRQSCLRRQILYRGDSNVGAYYRCIQIIIGVASRN